MCVNLVLYIVQFQNLKDLTPKDEVSKIRVCTGVITYNQKQREEKL